MLVDLFIVAAAVFAFIRGSDIGFSRQALSALGFVAGLLLGAALEPHIIGWASTASGRALIALTTALTCAVVMLLAGEIIGLRIKLRLQPTKFNAWDRRLGSALGVVSVLLSAWLLATLLLAVSPATTKRLLHSSHILGELNQLMPDAPTVIAGLGHLINPNGFPQVFLGPEPQPPRNIDVPTLGELQPAVQRAQDSVVKIAGAGCGGVVEGTGFVGGPGIVVTNAHVIAGIKKPYIQDKNGNHAATAVRFDPNLDLAMLRVSNLAGKPLVLNSKVVEAGTPAAVLGYPEGGPLTAKPAAVLTRLLASGRNIYGSGNSVREIYEIRAGVVPGNSGGPLLATDGSVIGVIFAESTSYQGVGYALTSPQVASQIRQVSKTSPSVSTGSCSQ